MFIHIKHQVKKGNHHRSLSVYYHEYTNKKGNHHRSLSVYYHEYTNNQTFWHILPRSVHVHRKCKSVFGLMLKIDSHLIIDF